MLHRIRKQNITYVSIIQVAWRHLSKYYDVENVAKKRDVAVRTIQNVDVSARPVFVSLFRVLQNWDKRMYIEGNTVVSNHVNSDHVSSFSCRDVWKVRQTTSGVYAITVTTSAYHSRRFGRLKVIVIWRCQGNGCINTGVRYPTICLISEIYKSRSFSFHNADSSK